MITPQEILTNLIKRHPRLESCQNEIWSAFQLLLKAYTQDGTLYICGNGGSAADSLHIEGELMKGFSLQRNLSIAEQSLFNSISHPNSVEIARKLQKGLRTLSLVNSISLATAISNDTDPNLIFAQPLYAWGRSQDTLLGISTSGNSQNVLNAFIVAKAKNMKSIGLSGKSGGQMKELADICIIAPGDHVWEIQEYHLPIYHSLCSMLEFHFFGTNNV